MRQRYSPQADFNILPIEKIVLPTRSRDELPPILAGLQWIWTHPALKAEIFGLLEGKILAGKKATGRQASLAKLERFVAAKPAAAKDSQLSPSNAQPSLPADRPLGFARKTRERINGALLHCEERYPSAGAHSVLYVVVDREAAQWRERLNDLHQDFFGPGKSDRLAPVQLEVVDRATHEALERLAARKLKMAKLLTGGDLADEARAALLDAALSLGRALAVEARAPEPASLDDALLPPLSHRWSDTLPLLRAFVADTTQSGQAVIERLEKV
jgi:hypothetical protein